MKNQKISTLLGAAAVVALTSPAFAGHFFPSSRGSFQHEHSAPTPRGPVMGTPAPGMPPPAVSPTTPPSGASTAPGKTASGGTTTATGSTGATGHGHHSHDDDDDDFFFVGGPYFYPFPDPYFVSVSVPVTTSPTNQYWYYCPASRSYYPWVRTCEGPWQPVPATPPPPPPSSY